MVEKSSRLGVFGGTFDPTHIGHLLLAERAREHLGLEKVLWVPAGDPWRKEGIRISAVEHRVQMVRLAIQGNSAFELCEMEARRESPSYTVETLVELQRRYLGADLFFLVGQDALDDLPNWYEADRLLELAILAVVPRGPGARELGRLEERLPALRGRVVWVEMPQISVSGTDIRARMAAGKTVKYVVPEAVEAYAREHRLYQDNT